MSTGILAQDGGDVAVVVSNGMASIRLREEGAEEPPTVLQIPEGRAAMVGALLVALCGRGGA